MEPSTLPALPALTHPLAAALAAFEAEAQALADAACPGLGVAVSIDTTERGALFLLYTFDKSLHRATYLHRTAVGAGYSAEDALAELRLSLALRYAPYSELVASEYPDLAEQAADSAIAHAKEEGLPAWA